MSQHPSLHVVVVGGGVAAVETVLALRDLAGDRVRLTLIAPEHEFELRPLRTAVPFSADHARRHPLQELARQVGAELITDTVVAVEPSRHALRTDQGQVVEYEALVLALGARQRPAFARAITFGGMDRTNAYNGLLADLEEGWSRSVAFVVPPGVSWSLPAYELALMTAAEVRSMGMKNVALEIVTPEEAPLEIFGAQAAEAVGGLLQEAGVTFRGGADIVPGEEGRLAFGVRGEPVTAERIVALPVLDGPVLPGIPTDDAGFIPVDADGRVPGVEDVFAAGDATAFPVKQGGLACQMADAIAERLAARAGADVEPRPFDPVLRGRLLTPQGAQLLEHRLAGDDGDGPAPRMVLWSPSRKIDGRYLSAWLAELDGETPPEPEAGVEVDVPLGDAWQEGRLARRRDPYGPLTLR
jgi:sulfide:quinone oxidoreductase